MRPEDSTIRPWIRPTLLSTSTSPSERNTTSQGPKAQFTVSAMGCLGSDCFIQPKSFSCNLAAGYQGRGHADDRSVPHLDQVGDPERQDYETGNEQDQRRVEQLGVLYHRIVMRRLDAEGAKQVAVIRRPHGGIGHCRHIRDSYASDAHAL
jgi:hypothetical protein